MTETLSSRGDIPHVALHGTRDLKMYCWTNGRQDSRLIIGQFRAVDKNRTIKHDRVELLAY